MGMPGIAIGEGTHDCAVVVLALAHCASTEAFVGQRMCDAFMSRRWHEIYDGVRNRVEALQGRAVERFGVNRTVWQAEAVALGLRRIEMPPGGISPETLTPLDPPGFMILEQHGHASAMLGEWIVNKRDCPITALYAWVSELSQNPPEASPKRKPFCVTTR